MVSRTAALLCLLLSACNPGGGLPDLPPLQPAAYRLGPGDVVTPDIARRLPGRGVSGGVSAAARGR